MVVRIVAGVAVTVVVAAGGTAYWALDRYVIDHVEISDVAAHEAAVRAQNAALVSAAVTTAATSAPDRTTAPTTPTTPSTTGASSTATAPVTVTTAAATTPTITDTSYDDGQTTITIETIVSGSGASTVTGYVADIRLGDLSRLRAGFADNKFGNNIVADTSEIAEAQGAILAINGDYYGFRDSGIVIRNGVLYRDDPARTGLAIYADGRMEIYEETATSGEALVAAGVVQTLSFGPALLDDGQIPAGIEDVEIDTNFGNHSVQGNQPRTGIGMIAPGHYVFVVVDGRSSGYSRGVTMTEFAQIFQDLGATVAYNLDGGGSSTMWFNGSLVNNPLGKGQERGTSDILYIG